ncbi:PE-PGRS family protein [Fibrella forsythiae]|uniref:PE-PGRS family protein n=1 Tax=Fibrella forsythiae TaxID=2817061 RepID=A0ABS3JP51_9BACT|nr:PE-PGRS family protein [Fibrella forsythiae]MBO0950984.1 PE-PGRS family protein [Fibrella forsythiae]
MHRFLVASFLSISLLACQNPTVTPVQFSTEPTMTTIDADQINEASGIADSRSMPGTLWVEQDGGSPAELALLGYDGHIQGKLAIPNATNRDWEDLTIGPGPQATVNYLYIAETGDNNGQYGNYAIYRLPEPKNLTDAVGPVEKINFKYPDGARDAETLLIDPQTRDLYVVSKRETKVHLYRLAYPQSTTSVITAELLGELPYTYVTGGAFSPDGSEVVIRTYTNIFYWSRKSGQSVADAMQLTAARDLPYRLEPQGEAICFDRQNKGYFTLSEKANGVNPTLNYYLRK